MKLMKSAAPHIRYQESSITMMLDVILIIGVLIGMAVFFYGWRALLVCLVGAVTCVVTDLICNVLGGKWPNPRDLSSVVTGLLISVMLPAGISYKVVIVASVFAIAVVKHPFGGTGHNVFNPAAAGLAFATVCWPLEIFLYPVPFNRLPIGGEFVSSLGAFVYQDGAKEMVYKLFPGISARLNVGGMPGIGYFELLFGNHTGPMGATQTLVLLAGLMYLLFRRTVRWQLPLTYFLTCGIIAWFFGRSGGTNLDNLMYEMSAGILMFAGVFLLNDPVTGPRRTASAVIYGVGTGVLVMLFRLYGGFEEGTAFAILLANGVLPILNRRMEWIYDVVRRRFDANKQIKTNA